MNLLFDVIMYSVFGVLALLAVLVVVTLVFGKRVRKQWEFEAEFRDANGREFGEFDIECSRIEKVEPDYTVKANLELKDAALTPGEAVRVFIDDTPVLEGTVTAAGYIRLKQEGLLPAAYSVRAGQRCIIAIGGREAYSEVLRPD